MAKLLVKIEYLIRYLLIKVVLSYSAVKGFYIHNKSSLISVHSNYIDSIYADLGGLVVW